MRCGSCRTARPGIAKAVRQAAVDANSNYLAAAEIWNALAERRREAQAKSCGGIAYWHTKDYARSAELAAEAAKLYAEVAEDVLSAKATYLQGTALLEIPGSDADRGSRYAVALDRRSRAGGGRPRVG